MLAQRAVRLLDVQAQRLLGAGAVETLRMAADERPVFVMRLDVALERFLEHGAVRTKRALERLGGVLPDDVRLEVGRGVGHEVAVGALVHLGTVDVRALLVPVEAGGRSVRLGAERAFMHARLIAIVRLSSVTQYASHVIRDEVAIVAREFNILKPGNIDFRVI